MLQIDFEYMNLLQLGIDDDRSQPVVFKAVAGRSRRQSSFPSALSRNPSQICGLSSQIALGIV